MFELSFGEILVIAAVALVVIGPEKLPKVARTLGVMLGRVQRYVANVKADISREVELDHLRRIEAEMNEAGRKLGAELRGEHAALQSELSQLGSGVQTALSEPAAPAHAAVTTHSSSVVMTDPPSAPPPNDGQYDLFADTDPSRRETDRR